MEELKKILKLILILPSQQHLPEAEKPMAPISHSFPPTPTDTRSTDQRLLEFNHADIIKNICALKGKSPSSIWFQKFEYGCPTCQSPCFWSSLKKQCLKCGGLDYKDSMTYEDKKTLEKIKNLDQELEDSAQKKTLKCYILSIMECVQQLRKELIPNCGQLSAKTNNTPSLSQLKDVADLKMKKTFQT